MIVPWCGRRWQTPWQATWLAIWLALLSVAPVGATASADETYRISADDGAPLFQEVSQLLRAAYRRLNIEIEIVQSPGRRSLAEANAGTFDGELLRAPAIEASFHNLLRVPTPVATIDIVALVGKDAPRIESRADLATLRVGYERGVMLIEKDPVSAGFHAGDDLDSLLTLLAGGKLDVVLDVPTDFEAAKRRLGLSQLQATDFVFASASMYHYLHKRHQDLVGKLNKAIQEERRLRGLN